MDSWSTGADLMDEVAGRSRGCCMECSAAPETTHEAQIGGEEHLSDRQQTADSVGQRRGCNCRQLRAVTKTRDRADEWFCVSNLACAVPASGLVCLFAGPLNLLRSF